MKPAFHFALLASITLRLTAVAACLPDAPEVLRVMERVADWQLAHPSSHGTKDWTQAAWYTGAMALAELSPSPKYLERMRAVAEGNSWQLGARTFHADDQCVGQTYVALSARFGDPRMLAPMLESFAKVLAEAGERRTLEFGGEGAAKSWNWCDALFMAPPAWIGLAHVTGDKRFLDYGVEQWWVTSDYLYDASESLFYRDSRFFTKREANGRKVFWSRGNGWVLAGLARVLEHLPVNHPARRRFERQFQDMATRIIGLQQADGLWRASLLDPESYPLKETSGSAFFCYALAWGINHQLLDAATAGPALCRAWAALVDCVDAEGKLTHVQPIGANPKDFPADTTECYGVGAFLLAGSEVYRWRELRHSASPGNRQPGPAGESHAAAPGPR